VLAKQIGDALRQLAIAVVDALAVHRDELDVDVAAAGPHAPNSSHVVVIPVRKLRGRAVVDVEHEVELLVIERLRVLFVLEA